MAISKVLPIALMFSAAGCSPDGGDGSIDADLYRLSEVYTVLNEKGRRTGEMAADSVLVRDRGNEVVAWNATVTLDRGPVQIGADSMTINWSTHEMRYHGEVRIPSLPPDIVLKDVTLYTW